MRGAHSGGTGLVIMALAAGLPGIGLAEFNPDGVFDAVEQHGVTRFFIVPAALQMLLMHPRCASVDYSRLKYILYGAAPIPLELLRQCIQVFGADFIQAYGMTETTGTISMRSEEHTSELQSLMRISYAVFCLKNTIKPQTNYIIISQIITPLETCHHT